MAFIGSRRVLLGAARGPRIVLSATSISEGAADNSVVGILSVADGSGTYTYTITADPDNKFAIANGNELQIDELLNYATAASHSVTIQADNSVDPVIVRTLSISVIETAPTVSSLDPADNATDVAIDVGELTITFNKNVEFGDDVSISLFKFDDTLVESWDESDIDGAAEILGAALTITLGAELNNEQAYYVQITSGSIVAAAGGTAFAGITNETTWSFTTVAAGGEAFAGGNQTHESLEDFGAHIAACTDADTSPTAGGTLTINGQSLGSYDYTIKDGNETISSFSNGDWFTTTEDSRSAITVVKGNLTINSGQTLIPSHRKLFHLLYVTGDLAIAGGISMTARGANHSTGAGNVTAAAIRIIDGEHGGVTDPEIPAAGANGGSAASNAVGNVGSNGASGATGGGASGGSATASGSSGAGAAGTAFTGGSAGAGNTASSTTSETAGASGDEGGDATADANVNRGSGGGAGNPGGTPAAAGGDGTASAGGDGTGGVLVIICLGELSGAGTITAHGVAGGAASGTQRSAGGGGSGGGSVTVLYGTDTSSITPTATGGLGGDATGAGVANDGGKGGDGTARKLALA